MYKQVLTLFVILTLLQLSHQESTLRTTSACEGHSLSLTCPSGERIAVVEADYGRWDATVCPYYDDPHMRTDCHSPLAATVLKIMCNGKQYCRIKASNSAFTDPCPGQVKYAQVHFLCVSKKQTLTFSDQNNILAKLF